MADDPQPGDYWRVCADPDPQLGIVLEVEGKTDDVDLISGEGLWRLYLTSNHDAGTIVAKRSWLRERVGERQTRG